MWTMDKELAYHPFIVTIKRKSVLAAVLLCFALFAAFMLCSASPWAVKAPPLGESPLLTFSSVEMSQLAKEQFLEGDFLIVKDLRALPKPVLQAFTEQGGSRLVMANPGKKFLAGDVIYDASLPTKRLILAGVSRD
jgi:hypothetical protein